jgi:hypothetical protein
MALIGDLLVLFFHYFSIRPGLMRDKINNIINVIHPYLSEGAWVFDDPEVDIYGQPVICGIPGIIHKVAKGNKKFTLIISTSPFPEYTAILKKLKDESPGWYKFDGSNIKGWLCPAYLKYFADFPDNIYIKIDRYNDPLSN